MALAEETVEAVNVVCELGAEPFDSVLSFFHISDDCTLLNSRNLLDSPKIDIEMSH